jgi:hypothetical protein
MKRTALSAASIAVLAFAARARAEAAEPERAAEPPPEPVRIVVEAPEACMTEVALRADLTSLGAVYRGAGDDERARLFRIVARGGTPASGTLVVRDLVGEETQREVSGADCGHVLRSVVHAVGASAEVTR